MSQYPPPPPSYGAYDQPPPAGFGYPPQPGYPAQPGYPPQPGYPAQPGYNPYQPGVQQPTVCQPAGGYYPGQPTTQTIVVHEKQPAKQDDCLRNCCLCTLCVALCCWCCND